MALTNGNKTNSGPLIFLDTRSQDKDGNEVEPHFEVSRSVDGKITKTGEKFNRVSGTLLRPQFGTKTWKGVESKRVTFYIRDDEANETYALGQSYRIPTRSLMNGVLSLTDTKGVSISVYRSKKGYEALSLWQNDELVPWKFDTTKGEIPEAEVIKDKKGNVVKTDFSEIDQFFEDKMKEWADKTFGPEKKKAEKAAPPAVEQGSDAPQQEAPKEKVVPKKAPADKTVPF